ncbi:DUF2637 domain-containing protein [Nocardiopsis alba]|uniref:DUF2637 domain-containing protein n=1 Tax=Nocardiopsis alba TaxID=53437 RepID=UPI0033FEC775
MAPYNNAPETGTRNGRSAGRGTEAGALVGGALFVSVIALCALILAYQGIYAFAVIVHEDSPLAHVFPVTFTLLVLMAFWVSYVLRTAPPRERLWVDLGVIPALMLAAAVPMILNNTGRVDTIAENSPGALRVVVAVAPLAALLVAFLLWLAVRAHIRRRNRRSRPRPVPSDDRATVVRGTSRPEPARKAPPLKTRLLDLGREPERDEPAPTAAESDEESRSRISPPPVIESTEPARKDVPEEREPDTSESVDSEAPTEPIPAPEPAEDERPAETVADTEPLAPVRVEAPVEKTAPAEDEERAGAPMVPLPRRSRTGDNPIKRAAEEPPVVPGAAAPPPEPIGNESVPAPRAAAEPEPEERVEDDRDVPVFDDRLDEGFAHEPEVGDPVSDEAEAPPLAPVAAEPEPAEWEAPEAEEGSEVEERPESTDEVESVTPSDAADPEDDEPLWEPPSAEGPGSILADYVPPVWTPPEDGSSATEDDDVVPPVEPLGRVEDPNVPLTLDHDTGPTVRAAFRLGAKRPEPEEDPEPERTSETSSGTTEAEPAERDREPEPEREEPPAPEPEPRPAPRTASEPAVPVRKRPMVLKPPRPPMPDFASGPPSRRVRSEPLPPEDH